jgi:VWFA-related protein
MRLVVFALTMALAAVVAANAQQGGRFSARVDAVRVDVLVTEGGKPVQGLTASDFELRDNGVLQQLDVADPDTMPVNAILALDLSASVEGERLTHLRQASHALLGALAPGEQASLVAFNHQVTLESDLTANLAAVGTALDRAGTDGRTSLIDAVYASLIVGESDAGHSLVLAFSDGQDTASWLTAARVIDIGKPGVAVVYGVSVRNPDSVGDDKFMRDVTTATGGSVIEVESTRNLSTEFVRILNEFRHRYLLRYSARGVSRTGYHKLEVRVKGRNVKIKARPGYQAG